MASDSRDPLTFAMGFVSNSDNYRKQYLTRWRETLANFMVDPEASYGTSASATTTPYSYSKVYRNSARQIILKDPETHKLVMTYAAKLVRALLGDPRHEYVMAQPVGWEDASAKAPTVTRLLRYAFNLPGHFRTMVEGIVDMILFGTATVEVYWKYEEREMLVRSMESTYGIETATQARMKMPVYDDVCISNIDIEDFYPDPSRYRVNEMMGAAKRFRMNAAKAMQMARAGVYDLDKVKSAITNTGGSGKKRETSIREGIDQPVDTGAYSELKDMVGYEYWGEIPWEDEGSSRGVITVLNGISVRPKGGIQPWPLADPFLPFHTLIINPMQGRFYGVSPAEVVRYDQSFADAIKILLAEAIVRQVHPPIAWDNSQGDVDLAAVKAWKADALVGVPGGPGGIGTLRYDANVNNGFAMLSGLKASIQESSGALGAIQGEPGPDREAASVGVQRVQMAMDRPELAAMILENECLPPIAAAILRRYQQFLGGTEDLALRIGEMPQPYWIGDIMGEFDIDFVGSRKAITRQQKMQSWDRIISMATAIPAFQMALPTIDMAKDIIGNLLELPELAAKVGDPQQMMLNALMAQAAGGGQGGPAQNGVPQSAEPAGMLPAQAGGGIVGS